jgi:hypothetical protein
MTEGVLHMQSSSRWAIIRPGWPPVEITSDELFRVEVPGKEGLQLTRLEFRHWETVDGVVQMAGYYSVDGYVLRDGLCAAIGVE